MLRKTVLKQACKLAPKNEKLNNAIALDNEDSTISDRIKKDRAMSNGLTMGELDSKNKNEKEENKEVEAEPKDVGSAKNKA